MSEGGQETFLKKWENVLCGLPSLTMIWLSKSSNAMWNDPQAREEMTESLLEDHEKESSSMEKDALIRCKAPDSQKMETGHISIISKK